MNVWRRHAGPAYGDAMTRRETAGAGMS